jgi:hypothetical protein
MISPPTFHKGVLCNGTSVGAVVGAGVSGAIAVGGFVGACVGSRVGALVGLSLSIEAAHPFVVHCTVRPIVPSLRSHVSCNGRYSVFAQYGSNVFTSFVKSVTLH